MSEYKRIEEYKKEIVEITRRQSLKDAWRLYKLTGFPYLDLIFD
ncbi:hypothetical protein ACFLUX_01285 [Chloroflexota bacterium]